MLNIDECRAQATDGETFIVGTRRSVEKSWGWERPHCNVEKDKKKAVDVAKNAADLGRWPANVCHDGSEEVVDLLPEAGGGFGKRGESPNWGPASHGGGAVETVGFGDSGSAARFFYCAKADADDRQGSKHPTVKPLALMRWLVRLVVPENGTVLDPFAGTGSTGAAAMLEGVDSVLIERDPDYVADIYKKLEFFRNKRSRTLF